MVAPKGGVAKGRLTLLLQSFGTDEGGEEGNTDDTDAAISVLDDLLMEDPEEDEAVVPIPPPPFQSHFACCLGLMWIR